MNTGNVPMDARSKAKLDGVHPTLAGLVTRFAVNSPQQFIVTEGRRTLQRQKELVAAGASRTLKSKHITGRAVDLAVVVNGEVRWDWPLYTKLADNLLAFAEREEIKIEAGAKWKTFPDGPHFQLADSEP